MISIRQAIIGGDAVASLRDAAMTTSDSEKKFASIRVIRGYKIDHQRSAPDNCFRFVRQ
jgi:hypothetical protein